MRPKAIILLACLFMLLILHVFPSVDALAQRGISVARNQPSGSSRRVALVIGNAAYRESPLKNPVNDARSMASALKHLGFSVIEGEDLTFRQMRRKFIEFGREIDKGGVGLFYYAGHGVQVNGRNYLLPVGAEIKHEEEVEVEGVALDSLLARMAGAKNGLNIIILDACRNNPYERSFRSGGSRGLAQVVAPKGTVIAYATAPGKTAADGSGRHGVFTEAILRHIQNPNYDLEDFFKQVGRTVDSRTSGTQRPWMASDYYGQFAFAAGNHPARKIANRQEPRRGKQKTGKSKDDGLAHAFVGVWEGIGIQNNGQKWPIKATVTERAVTVAYPSLRCGGYWDVLSVSKNKLVAIEYIKYGKSNCLNKVPVIVTTDGNNTANCSFYYPQNPTGKQIGTLSFKREIAKAKLSKAAQK